MAHRDYLMHYGVKGMKWGVRRTPEQLKRSAARRERANEQISILRNYTGSKRSSFVKKARRRDIDAMSNQELQEAITRMNLERQYRSLTKADFMSGQKFASNVLKYDKSYSSIKGLAIAKKATLKV